MSVVIILIVDFNFVKYEKNVSEFFVCSFFINLWIYVFIIVMLFVCMC